MPTKLKTRKPRVARETKTRYKIATRPSLSPLEAKALATFRARLKEILADGELKSLILYGSKARGEAHPDSDIDLLIVYDSARGDMKDAIWDAAFEIEMDLVEQEIIDIQPLVHTSDELTKSEASGMPLLQNIVREGIVLEGAPITPAEMDRKYWTPIYLEDAKQSLRSAQLMMAHSSFDHAISMVYSVFLDATRAALIAKGVPPESHVKSHNLFKTHLIENGLIPKKFGPLLDQMHDNHIEAMYKIEKRFTRQEAERALAAAEELLTLAENLIPNLLGDV